MRLESPRLPARTARLDACRRAASGGGTARASSQHRADQCNREIMARIIRYAEIAEPGIVRRSWNYFGRHELNEGHRFEECYHAPSHLSGRKPLQTPRPDRRRPPPLVN